MNGILQYMPVLNASKPSANTTANIPSQFKAYDQYAGGNGIQRGNGGIQSTVQGRQITQYGRPIAEDPRFADILAPIYNPVSIAERGQNYFQQGLQTSQPSTVISPDTQQILDIIRQQQDYAQKQGIAQAQSLAAKRGVGGSSMEQFGVQQAIENAARSGQDATAQALGQNFAANLALRQLQSQGLFQRGAQQQDVGITEGQLNANRDALAANLTSDELASLRNLSSAAQDRILQQYLGERGIQAQNIATQQRADQAAEENKPLNRLIGGVGVGVGSPF